MDSIIAEYEAELRALLDPRKLRDQWSTAVATAPPSFHADDDSPAMRCLSHELRELHATNVALRARATALRKLAAVRSVSKRMLEASLDGAAMRSTSAPQLGDPSDEDLYLIRATLKASVFSTPAVNAAVSEAPQYELRASVAAAAWQRGLEERVLGDALRLASVHGVQTDGTQHGNSGPTDVAVQTDQSSRLLLHNTRAATAARVPRPTAEASAPLRPWEAYYPRRHSDVHDAILAPNAQFVALATRLVPPEEGGKDLLVRLTLTPTTLTMVSLPSADAAPQAAGTDTLPLGYVTDCVMSYGHPEFAAIVSARLAPEQRFPGYACEVDDRLASMDATAPAATASRWRIDTRDSAMLAACGNRALTLLWIDLVKPTERYHYDDPTTRVEKHATHLVFEHVQQMDDFVRGLDAWAPYAKPRRLGVAFVPTDELPLSLPVGDQIVFDSPVHAQLSLNAAKRLADEELHFCGSQRIAPAALYAVKKRLFSAFTRSVVPAADVLAVADVSPLDLRRILGFYQNTSWLQLHTVFRVQHVDANRAVS